MQRQEFINLLTDSLVGRVPTQLVSEKADYYRQYITNQAASTGKSESEVIEELGPPEAIAHTIIDVYEAEYGIYEGSVREEAERSSMEHLQETEGKGRNFLLNLNGPGCFLLGFIAVVLFIIAGTWIVRILTAHPLLVVLAVLALYFWMQYQKRER